MPFNYSRGARRQSMLPPEYEPPEGAYVSSAMLRAEAFFNKSRSHNPRNTGTTPKRSPSAQVHSTSRRDDFRTRKGNEKVEALVSEFKKNLLAGFDSIEEVINARKFETLSRAMPIPVSSRAIGFSVQVFSFYNSHFSSLNLTTTP
ncbi:hypothetical protein QE152_g7674 [Popillia japonica]|uniref:Uncharacterized protein n=1 Tax=Popillia japonica TaxID=7064 RepID=A0AAW1MDQ5_POPJA